MSDNCGYACSHGESASAYSSRIGAAAGGSSVDDMLTNDALDADDACLLPAVLVLPGTGDADADGARCNVDGTRIENVRHAPGTGRGGDFTCVLSLIHI